MRAFLERHRYGLLLGWILVSLLVAPAVRTECQQARRLPVAVFTVPLAVALQIMHAPSEPDSEA